MTKENGFACYAMLIDNATLEIIAKHFPNETFEDHAEMAAFLMEEGIVDYISEFTGQAFPLDKSGAVWYSDYYAKQFNNSPVVYIPLRRQPSLFSFCPCYHGMESIIAELKVNLEMYLPADYDYRQHLRFIVGSYYG